MQPRVNLKGKNCTLSLSLPEENRSDQQKEQIFSRSICLLFALLVHVYEWESGEKRAKKSPCVCESVCVCAQAGKQQIITHKLKELFDQVYQFLSCASFPTAAVLCSLSPLCVHLM
jgi:hypothetical protein